jgi:two-component system, LytTR family, response regulator LytT
MEQAIRILIVEDEAIIAENLSNTLEDLGYDIVAVCHHIASAKHAIDTLEFDIALLDINLKSEESGIDIAKYLKQKVNVPFVFLTAYSDASTVEQAAAIHPAAYLVKPTTGAALFATIQTAFSNFYQSETKSTGAKEEDFFYIKQNKTMKRVEWSDVVAMKSERNYVAIKTTDNIKVGYLVRSTLQQAMTQLLPPSFRDQFLQINRSETVLIKSITEYNKEFVLTNYAEHQVGETYWDKIKESLPWLK